ncbi:MAG: YdcH family protein [Parvularculaceae bacterium]
MALNAHLQSLGRRHHELDVKLQAELKNPHVDENRALELKRQKLKIKDQMAELERRQ